MKNSHRQHVVRWLGVALLVTTCGIWMYSAVGRVFYGGHQLGLGSIMAPSPQFLGAVMWALLVTGASCLAVTYALAQVRVAPHRFVPMRKNRVQIQHRLTLLVLAFALAATLWVESDVLNFAVLTDDEAAYRFSAEILNLGRLFAESHPLKQFFDNAFIINDGKYYSQYFLGWPALLALAMRVGLAQWLNPLLFVLTIPGVVLTVQRLAGRRAGILAGFLFAASPMLIVASATQLSHTSCVFFLVWATWAAVQLRYQRRTHGRYVLFALLFCGAFFIRPANAVFVAGVFWLPVLQGLRGAGGLKRAAALLVPTVLLASLFLYVNTAQTGAPLRTAYQRYLEYTYENNFAFAPWDRASLGKVAHSGLTLISDTLSETLYTAWSFWGVGLMRLLVDLWGTPLVWVPIVFAFGHRRLRWVYASLVTSLLGQVLVSDAGVDSFGPTHWIELSWPITICVAVGWNECARWSARWAHGRAHARVVVYGALLTCLLMSATTFVRTRWNTLRVIAQDINAPLEALMAANLKTPSLIFAHRPFAPPCQRTYGRHFVFFRPNSDPLFHDPIVWANDLGPDNGRLVDAFPDRTPYVMRITPKCEYLFVPWSNARAASGVSAE